MKILTEFKVNKSMRLLPTLMRPGNNDGLCSKIGSMSKTDDEPLSCDVQDNSYHKWQRPFVDEADMIRRKLRNTGNCHSGCSAPANFTIWNEVYMSRFHKTSRVPSRPCCLYYIPHGQSSWASHFTNRGRQIEGWFNLDDRNITSCTWQLLPVGFAEESGSFH